MEINVAFDFTFNTNGYPGSQYCLGKEQPFKIGGTVGTGSNVEQIRLKQYPVNTVIHYNDTTSDTMDGSGN